MILIAFALLAADPSTVAGVVAAAKPGDTVRLVAGRYPVVTIKSRTFDPPLTIDASAATVAGVQVVGSTGIRWSGGTISGDKSVVPAVGYGIFAGWGSKAVTVTGVHISDLRVGIVFDSVVGGEISGNWLARMSVDGIDLAASRQITVAHNACSDFRTAEDAHPDCIQAWSRPTDPPTADIAITANSIVGAMQGISLFNHLRDGIDDGGFDRVTISGNTVLNTYANGIAANDCRGCSIRNNSVSSLPNYINRAQLYVVGGSVTQCGNDVPMVPRQATPPCPSGG